MQLIFIPRFISHEMEIIFPESGQFLLLAGLNQKRFTERGGGPLTLLHEKPLCVPLHLNLRVVFQSSAQLGSILFGHDFDGQK